MPYSHHSHSGQFCKHAAGTLEDVVREAIRQCFDVYGLTEHVPRYRLADLYPEEVNSHPLLFITMPNVILSGVPATSLACEGWHGTRCTGNAV